MFLCNVDKTIGLYLHKRFTSLLLLLLIYMLMVPSHEWGHTTQIPSKIFNKKQQTNFEKKKFRSFDYIVEHHCMELQEIDD